MALDDQPRLAVAVAHGTALVLPIGHDTDRVQVQPSRIQVNCNCGGHIMQHTMKVQTSDKVMPVYQDSSVQIAAVPNPGGDLWQVNTSAKP